MPIVVIAREFRRASGCLGRPKNAPIAGCDESCERTREPKRDACLDRQKGRGVRADSEEKTGMSLHLRPNRPWSLSKRGNIKMVKAMEFRGNMNGSGDVTRNVSERPKMRDAITVLRTLPRPPITAMAIALYAGTDPMVGYTELQ